MSDTIMIVKPEESDLVMIRDLLVELMEYVDGYNPDSLNIQRIDDRCRTMFDDPVSHFLIAKDGGTVVGFINFTTRKTLYHDALSGLIDELIVTKAYRGNGIGKQLVSATLDICCQLGCCEVEVSTLKSNNKARDFYKSCGFTENGVFLEINLD
jgi:GNAT superfamily N-acetyltransferase